MNRRDFVKTSAAGLLSLAAAPILMAPPVRTAIAWA